MRILFALTACFAAWNAASALGFDINLNFLNKLKLRPTFQQQLLKKQETEENVMKSVENHVRKMQINLSDKVKVRNLIQPQVLGRHFKKQKNQDRVKKLRDTFKWSSCGPKGQPINIKNLTVNPQPLEFPGDVQIGFDVQFNEDVPHSDNLKANVTFQYQQGSQWITLPCIGSFGSCMYDDLCASADTIKACPDAFIQNNVPCKCPFNKGEYSINTISFEIDASVFFSGNYHANVTVGSNRKGNLGCYELWFSVD